MGLPNRCEAQIDENCHGGMFLTVAHRHKRSWYYKCPEKLTDIKQIAIFCVYCHDYLEHRREKHEEVFMRLRGEESA